MACKEDRFDCGGRTYLIRQMPPTLAMPVEVYLARTLGQPIFKAFSTADMSGEGAFAMAIGLFADKLNDAELMRHIQTMFRYVGIQDECVRICDANDGGAGLDKWFMGRNLELWQIVVAAIKVNFADFLGGSPLTSSLFEKLKGLVTSPRRTSTSTSGDPASATPPSAATTAASETAPTR